MKPEWWQAINEMREAGYALWWFTPHEIEQVELEPGIVEDWMADALTDIQQYYKNGGE